MRKNSRSAQRPLKPFRAAARWSQAFLVTAALAPLLAAAPARAQVASGPASAEAAQYLSLGASAAYAFQDSSSGSALAQITRAQNGTAPSAPSAPAPVMATPSASLIQASFTPSPDQPRLEPAIARVAPRPLASFGPDPSLFGSVALPVSHTGLDARWLRAEYAPLPTDARWRQAVRAAAELPAHERLRQVNTWVNHAVTFQNDDQGYGVSDYWASARETLARGKGDCEDYAITKLEMLRAAGVPASNLYLVVAKDLVRRVDHALLVVRLDDGYWVLDSGTDEVLPAEAVADYRPVVTFSAGKEWIHGYKRAPDLVLASASRLTPSFGR